MLLPKSLSIFIPIYNEIEILEERVEYLLSEVARSGVADFELLLVENGSDDGTIELAGKIEDENPSVRVLHLPEPNYGAAQRMGYTNAQKELVLQFSLDWIDFDFLERAYAEIGDADLVCGCKINRSDDGAGRPLLRIIISGLFQNFEHLLFRIPVSDTHGNKLARQVLISEVAERCGAEHEAFDTELLVRSHAAGHRVKGIPLFLAEIRPPRISLVWRGIRSVFLLSKLWVRLHFGPARI